MLSEQQQKDREEFIAGLREAVDFFDARPELKTPSSYLTTVFNLVASDKAELLAIRRLIGSVEKREWGGASGDEYISLRKNFRGNFHLEVSISKNATCERVIVGKETIPAKPARTIELPAEPEKVVDKYEWRCNGLLASADEPSYAESINAAVPDVEFPQTAVGQSATAETAGA